MIIPFSIEPMSRQPVYEQLIEQVERFVLTGDLSPGQQLPSVRGLSVSLSVNPNTIQKAYTELDRRGIVIAVPGRGCYVSEDASPLLMKGKQKRLTQIEGEIYELALAGVHKENVIAAVEAAYDRAIEWKGADNNNDGTGEG